MLMTPSLNLFLVALIAGFGAGLGWTIAAWLWNFIVSATQPKNP